MQTAFTPAQLADPNVAAADAVLRSCVHCGFCLATCPTYLLLGDERDSPRGRIYQIKDFLEDGRAPSHDEARHVDRCLSCLSCMTTCPASVHYMHLVDIGRAHIEATYRRPWPERALRALLAAVLPDPGRFRAALLLARLARPFGPVLPRTLRGMLALAPAGRPAARPIAAGAVFPASGARRKRVALLAGCVQQALAPQINAATIRLLTRLGCEVVVAEGAGCCGALVHHLGRADDAHAAARRNVDAWLRVAGEEGGLDAVVVNASGCGTMIKDYGFMLRADPEDAERAARVSALARDVTELVAELGLDPAVPTAPPLNVTYQSACSMQHGQNITTLPKQLLERAGFTVRTPAEAHLCCGSAGTYNILQPALAARLRARKLAAIENTEPDVVASGNIGCITQLAGGTDTPVVHTVELLDWATGGPRPPALGPSPG
jgi:glycolate oxidase iron-sulfur subunit